MVENLSIAFRTPDSTRAQANHAPRKLDDDASGVQATKGNADKANPESNDA